MSLSSLGWTAGCDFQQGHQKSSQMSGKQESTAVPFFLSRTVNQRLRVPVSFSSAIANFTSSGPVPNHFYNPEISFIVLEKIEWEESAAAECFLYSRKKLIVIHRFYSQKRLLPCSLTSCVTHAEELMLKMCWKWKAALPREAQLQQLDLTGALPSLLGGISSLHLLFWTKLPFLMPHHDQSRGYCLMQTDISMSFPSYLQFFSFVLAKRTGLLPGSGRAGARLETDLPPTHPSQLLQSPGHCPGSAGWRYFYVQVVHSLTRHFLSPGNILLEGCIVWAGFDQELRVGFCWCL